MTSSGCPGVTGVPFSTSIFDTVPDVSACAHAFKVSECQQQRLHNGVSTIHVF